MTKTVALLFSALLTTSLAVSAIQNLDGTRWVSHSRDIGGSHDVLTFQEGFFASGTSLHAGGQPVAYDSKTDGTTTVWTAAEEQAGGGRRIWQGAWDGRSDEMAGTYSFPTKEGRIDTAEWTARRAKRR